MTWVIILIVAILVNVIAYKRTRSPYNMFAIVFCSVAAFAVFIDIIRNS